MNVDLLVKAIRDIDYFTYQGDNPPSWTNIRLGVQEVEAVIWTHYVSTRCDHISLKPLPGGRSNVLRIMRLAFTTRIFRTRDGLMSRYQCLTWNVNPSDVYPVAFSGRVTSGMLFAMRKVCAQWPKRHIVAILDDIQWRSVYVQEKARREWERFCNAGGAIRFARPVYPQRDVNRILATLDF